MKAENLILLGGAALLAFMYLRKDQTIEGVSTGSAFPGVIDSLRNAGGSTYEVPVVHVGNKQTTVNPEFTNAVNDFSNAPVNTKQSIQAGINIINTAAKAGIQLPRLSGTIVKGSIQADGSQTNVAKLADGSVKTVTVRSIG